MTKFFQILRTLAVRVVWPLIIFPISYYVIVYLERHYYFVSIHLLRQRYLEYLSHVIIVMAFLFAIAFTEIYRRSRIRHEQAIEAQIREIDALTLSSAAAKTLIISLRRRSAFLRRAASLTLYLTFIAIAAGLYIFTSAGAIAQRDLSSRFDTEDEFYYRVFLRELDYATREGSSSEVIRELQLLRKDTTDFHARRQETLDRIANRSGTNEQLFFFLSTVATRLGSIFLIIFLVQILLSVYRYSIRLVSFYEARADALSLFGGSDADQLQKLVGTLAAEGIHFGKAPATPIEQASELLKSTASSASLLRK